MISIQLRSYAVNQQLKYINKSSFIGNCMTYLKVLVWNDLHISITLILLNQEQFPYGLFTIHNFLGIVHLPFCPYNFNIYNY